MKVIRNKIKNTIAKRFGFTVVGLGYNKRHYCMSFSEALEWACCYDDGAIIVKGGIIIAQKGYV